MNKDSDKIIEVFSGTLWEAELLKSILSDAKINCFLKNAVINSNLYDPIMSHGVKIMIQTADEKEAKTIVDDFYKSQSK